MVMETGEEPRWLEKGKCCTSLQQSLKVQYRELQAHQPLFTLQENHGRSLLGVHLCIDVGGGDWESSAWVRSEENLFPCENSQELE